MWDRGNWGIWQLGPIIRLLFPLCISVYHVISPQDLVETVLDQCHPTVHLNTPVTKLTLQSDGRWQVNSQGPAYDAVALCVSPSLTGVTMETDDEETRDLVASCQDVQFEDVISYYHGDNSVGYHGNHDYYIRFYVMSLISSYLSMTNQYNPNMLHGHISIKALS